MERNGSDFFYLFVDISTVDFSELHDHLEAQRRGLGEAGEQGHFFGGKHWGTMLAFRKATKVKQLGEILMNLWVATSSTNRIYESMGT